MPESPPVVSDDDHPEALHLAPPNLLVVGLTVKQGDLVGVRLAVVVFSCHACYVTRSFNAMMRKVNGLRLRDSPAGGPGD